MIESFLLAVESHLDLIVAIVSFFMALFAITGAFVWHKFIIQSTSRDVEKLKEDQSKNGELVADVRIRLTSMEVSITAMKDDLKMIKNYILGNKEG